MEIIENSWDLDRRWGYSELGMWFSWQVSKPVTFWMKGYEHLNLKRCVLISVYIPISSNVWAAHENQSTYQQRHFWHAPEGICGGLLPIKTVSFQPDRVGSFACAIFPSLQCALLSKALIWITESSSCAISTERKIHRDKSKVLPYMRNLQHGIKSMFSIRIALLWADIQGRSWEFAGFTAI